MTTRGYLIAGAVFALDQLVKWLMLGPLALREVGQIVLLPIFNLTWTENYGVSLGMLTADTDAMRWGLVALTGAIAIGVAVWIARERNRWDRLALALVLGGALGNILDRVRFGFVVDFLDLHFGEFRPFLVFNVADAAITLGVVLLLVRSLLLRDKPAKHSSNLAAEAAAPETLQ
jgi:signal peptidase II